MMPGMIMLWYGSIATIPSGWAHCDGTNGTPDLRSEFVFGAHADDHFYKPGQTGGGDSHRHDFTGDGHAHDLAAGNEVVEDSPNGDHYHGTSTIPASGTTDFEVHMPPYRCLAYIMKLPIP